MIRYITNMNASEIKSEVGQIVMFFRGQGRKYEECGGVFGNKVKSFLAETSVILPQHQTTPHGIPLTEKQQLNYFENLENELFCK